MNADEDTAREPGPHRAQAEGQAGDQAGEQAESGHTVTLTGPLAPRSGWAAVHCSMRKALDVAGNTSALLILREAFYGTTRFDDFAERARISQPVAAARLRDLVEHGLLERYPYRESGQRARMGYRLTDKGAALFPVLVALMQWGDQWLAPAGAPVVLYHHGCGAPVAAQLRCSAGHQTGADELELAAGPGRGRHDQPAPG